MSNLIIIILCHGKDSKNPRQGKDMPREHAGLFEKVLQRNEKPRRHEANGVKNTKSARLRLDQNMASLMSEVAAKVGINHRTRKRKRKYPAYKMGT